MDQIVQIAGIQDADEANLLLDAGVDWLGFPLRLTYHQPDLTDAAAAGIIASLAAPHRGVLITYLDKAREIAALCKRLGTNTVQLHNDVSVDTLSELRVALPELYIIKSLVVRADNGGRLRQSVTKLTPFVDAFLTDTFDAATGASGATGKTHDWRVSRELVEISERPVILAGGLTAENVAEAIAVVRPAGVDAHTGVEGVDGRKAPEKVRRFVLEARRAFQQKFRNLGK